MYTYACTGVRICTYILLEPTIPIKIHLLFSMGEIGLKNIITHQRGKSKNTPDLVALCLGFHDHRHYTNSPIPKIPKSLMGETLTQGATGLA